MKAVAFRLVPLWALLGILGYAAGTAITARGADPCYTITVGGVGCEGCQDTQCGSCIDSDPVNDCATETYVHCNHQQIAHEQPENSGGKKPLYSSETYCYTVNYCVPSYPCSGNNCVGGGFKEGSAAKFQQTRVGQFVCPSGPPG